MQFEYALLILTLGISLGFWGIIRTAVWILPGLFVEGLLSLSSASLLSFFAVVSFAATYREKAFDLRQLRKDHWVLIFFSSGVLGASLLYPVPLMAFGFCSLLPLLCIQIFRLVRFPLSHLYVFPRWVRWIAPISWGIAFLFRWISP